MNKLLPFFFLILFFSDYDTKPDQYIARLGQVSFFSYTSVENIEAKNNQVLSILDLSKNEIGISMLMRGFVFKKSLMHEHFNESYIESDIYPKATFSGKIIDFDATTKEPQTRMIIGDLTIHGITEKAEIKTTIELIDNHYVLTGEFSVSIKNFDIKVPPILSSNIAKNISIKFRFEYNRYEE
tara:strand:+ start:1175 stop:1723 length:549 start_codon:yes stop_codon:yes gene_type:complete